MKSKANDMSDELRPEYDFGTMTGGVRGKYSRRYGAGSNLVLLAPDVAEVFHDNTSVNEALRSLISVARAQVPIRKSGSNKKVHATS